MGVYAIAATGLVGGGAAITWWARKKFRTLLLIRRRVTAAASRIETDLKDLQLMGNHDPLARGWNRLLDEIGSLRLELEDHQTRQLARDTLDRYHLESMSELLGRMPYGLLIVSRDLTVTFANTAAERLLRQDDQELLGRPITEIFDESLSGLRTLKGGSVERTFNLESPEISVRVSAVSSSEDESGGEVALFLRDVSYQREGERARDQFLYHITHELRTPLTNIRAYAETLSEGVFEDPETVRECYNVIMGETQRLSRLVEDILSVSQLEAGSVRLNMDDVQVARLVRKVVEDMQAAADEKQVDLVLSLPAKVPVIRGDKDRLHVVLTNLIGNAIKYTPDGGRVHVTCLEDGAKLSLEVKDTGIGIHPDDRDKIFDKFYRAADEQVAKLPGTGLGLAIARETVRAHGGTIELQSEPGVGSTFTILLPIGKLAAIHT
jgi:signal transduction histidine kinase